MTSVPGTSTRDLVAQFDGLLVDLDGVVYVGANPVGGATEALQSAKEQGVRICYVTNNAARSPEVVAAQLRSLGIPVEPEQILTAAQVAAERLATQFPPGALILTVGGEGLHQAVKGAGFRVATTAAQGPVAAVQGFGPDVGWRQLAELSVAVQRGVYWVATNLDLTFPTPQGLAPGNGALVQAVATASGRAPHEVIGKPQPTMFTAAAGRFQVRRPLVIGDRLDTDIAGARAAGVASLLVLTGVSDTADLLACPRECRPEYVGQDLGALHVPHPTWPAPARCVQAGGWESSLAGGVLMIEGAGAPLDAVRCATAVAWWAEDLGERVEASEVVDRLHTLLAPPR